MTGPPSTISLGASRRMSAALAITTTSGFGVFLYTMSVMIGPMAADLGWRNATISAGPTTGMIVSGLCAPFVGRSIDLRGGRAMMVVGSLIGAAGVLAWSTVGILPVYFAAWVVIGIGMSMSLYQPAFATIVRYAPGRARQGVLAVTLVGALASTIFIPLADTLVGLVGWQSALMLLAAVHVTLTVPVCLLWVPSRSTDEGLSASAGTRTDASRVVAAPEPLVVSDDATGPEPGTSAPTLMRSAALRRIVAATVLGSSTNSAVAIHLVAFLVMSGRSPSMAAAIAGVLGVAKVAGRLAMGIAAKHWGSRGLLSFTFLIMAVALALPLISPSGPADVVMVAMFGAASGASTILHPLFVTEQFGQRVFGVTSGRIARFGNTSNALSPLAVGGVVTLTASYGLAWTLLAAGCMVASLILLGARWSHAGLGDRSTASPTRDDRPQDKQPRRTEG